MEFLNQQLWNTGIAITEVITMKLMDWRNIIAASFTFGPAVLLVIMVIKLLVSFGEKGPIIPILLITAVILSAVGYWAIKSNLEYDYNGSYYNLP